MAFARRAKVRARGHEMNPDSQCKGGQSGIEGIPDGAMTFPCPICKAICEVIRPREAGGRKPLPKLESHKFGGDERGRSQSA